MSRRAYLASLLALGLTVLYAGLSSAGDEKYSAYDLDGQQVDLLKGDGLKAAVLFFIAHDCPISNGYAPEINRICAEYSPHRVVCYVVYVEPDLPAAEAKAHAKAYGYSCPTLRDPSHELVKATRVTMTPEAAVLSPEGRVLYRGRIDDLYVDVATRRYAPTTRDLRAALDAILRGKPVRRSSTRAVGCFIPGAK